MSSKGSSGAYSITAKGVDTSAPNLGAALSKALTHATRLQLAGLDDGETLRSIYIRRLGEDAVARLDVEPDLISTYVLVPVRR